VHLEEQSVWTPQEFPLEALEEREQQPSTAALILLDPLFKPVSYDAEAVQILAWPHDSGRIHPIGPHIENKLRLLLEPLRVSGRTEPTSLQLGRREYRARCLTLRNHRKTPTFGAISHVHAAYALLLERQHRKRVEISLVAEQFHLTRREQETLHFLLQGMTSKEIATQMGVSPHTVTSFLRSMMSKMQVSTRAGLIGKIVRLTD